MINKIQRIDLVKIGLNDKRHFNDQFIMQFVSFGLIREIRVKGFKWLVDNDEIPFDQAQSIHQQPMILNKHKLFDRQNGI